MLIDKLKLSFVYVFSIMLMVENIISTNSAYRKVVSPSPIKYYRG